VEGLTQAYRLLTRYTSLKEHVERLEAHTLPAVEELAARQRERGRRFWETNYDRQAEKLRAALERFRLEAAAAKAELDAFEEYNSPERQVERFNRGEIFGLAAQDEGDVTTAGTGGSPVSVDLVVGEAIGRLREFLEAQFGDGTSPDGSRVAFPTWVAWQSAKAEVALAAGVMDEDVSDALTAQREAHSGTAEEDRARTHYNTELDRVIAANGLENAVERVVEALFGPEPG
jgi:hypothetical protein